ncbi:MAG: hypothetical protein AB4911_11340 [Oscillochloridaceae bacterium umkhey_bin13]
MTINDPSLAPPSPLSVPQTAVRSSEWSFAALVIALVLVITALPPLFAYLTAPSDRVFTGVIFNIPDHNQYFAWMRDLSSANLAPNRLTAEPNEPALFHLLWWTAGRVGAWFGLSVGAIFGILRVLGAAVLLVTAYAFLRVTVADLAQRRLAFVIFAFGGGLGIVWVVVKYLLGLPDAPFPFDIYTSEPNSFFLALAFPHFAIALALVIAMIGLTFVAHQRQQLRYAVAAGLIGTLIGLQHAYDLLTVATILSGFTLLIWWRDRRFPVFLLKAGMLIAIFTIPPGAYLSYLVLTDATWGGKLAQFDNAGAWTPGPLHLPILLGVPFLLAILAFRPRMLQSRSDAEILIAVWFLSHFGLVYLPLKFQIHLLLGWQVPIAILAAAALLKLVGPWTRTRWGRRSEQFVLAGLLGLAIITNGYLVAWRIIDLGRYAAPYYLSKNEAAALTWLEQHTTRADVVLGELEINQHVPAWTDARAFLAHWAGTLDYFAKLDAVQLVLDPAIPEAERQAVLDQFGVTYLIVREQDVALDALAVAAPSLRPVFSQGEVTIFRYR